MSVAFQLRQRGELRVEAVTQSIIDAQSRAVSVLLNEVTKNLTGRVVQRHRGRLVASLMASIVASPGQVVGTVGFDKKRGFIARFLERGTKPHELGKGARTARKAFGRRRAQRARGAFAGDRNVILAIPLGGGVIFRRGAFHPGLPPRPILAAALETARPLISSTFQVSIGKALHG